MNIQQVLVVRTEGQAGSIEPLTNNPGDNGVQVFTAAALPDQHRQARAQFCLRLLKGDAFVVGADARGRVRLQQRLRRREMPVQHLAAEEVQLFQHTGRAVRHPVKIHHFPQPGHTGMRQEGG